MNILELICIAIGLSMDACAVSICKGLSSKSYNIKKGLIIGSYFGGFQALMPLIGYYLGNFFKDKIIFIDHYISLVLLSFIGISMIREAFNKETISNASINYKEMIILAISTSIDALIVGITLSFLNVNIWLSTIIIGLITFIITNFGFKIGTIFGNKYGKIAEIIGGIILILMGIKIVLEHLNII